MAVQRYNVEQILELSAAASAAPEAVKEFCVQFQEVADILAAREARKARKKLPNHVTDDDGWTSFVKHEDEAEEGDAAEEAEDEFVAPVKKSKAAAATMRVKTSASKMTRGGNGAEPVALTQTKAFNAFAALGGDDDEDDE